MKWILLVTLACIACQKEDGQITGATGSGGESGEPILVADYVARFNDGSEVLTWDDNEQGTWIVEGGKLKVSGGITGNVMTLVPSPSFGKDYVVWVDTEWLDGKNNFGYGLSFNIDRNGRGYAFDITADGLFGISRWDGERLVRLHQWKRTPSIVQNGKNRLKIDVVQSEFTFYINSIEVASLIDSSYSGGRVAIGVSELQQVAFDNLSVAERNPLLKPIVTSQ
jgi:hypothetical protein